jgi:hypothetical protein
MTNATKQIVITAINAGATATSIIALIGGGGLIALLIKKAFQKGAKKVIIAA